MLPAISAFTTTTCAARIFPVKVRGADRFIGAGAETRVVWRCGLLIQREKAPARMPVRMAAEQTRVHLPFIGPGFRYGCCQPKCAPAEATACLQLPLDV